MLLRDRLLAGFSEGVGMGRKASIGRRQPNHRSVTSMPIVFKPKRTPTYVGASENLGLFESEPVIETYVVGSHLDLICHRHLRNPSCLISWTLDSGPDSILVSHCNIPRIVARLVHLFDFDSTPPLFVT